MKKDGNSRIFTLSKTQALSPKPLALCFIGALLLAGCTAQRPRDKDELLVGIATYPSDFDPRTGSDQASDRLHSLVYDGLFENGEDLQPSPVLVEKVLQSGPLVYEFKLRDGIRFHDGRTFTSADAAFTLNSIISGGVSSFRRGDLAVIEKVEAPEPQRLRLTLKTPFAPLLANLNFGVLPAGTLPDEAKERPVGTGPYRFLSAEKSVAVRLESNPDYFRGAPGMRRLTLRAFSENTLALEMKKGALDLVSEDLSPDNLAALAKDPRFTLDSRPGGTTFAYLVFNCTRPPFDRPGVRRALAMLLDREGIVTHLLGGRATLADSLLPVFHWAYAPPQTPLRFDAGGANRLLDEAGLRRGADGRRFSFVYRSSTDPGTLAIAQVYQQSLKEAGIEMKIVPTYWGFFFEDLKKGNFDLAGGRWVGLTDPDGYRLRFGAKYFPPDGMNRGRFSNPEMDRLIELGAVTVEAADRKIIYGQVQKIFRDEMPYIPLFHSHITILHGRDLEGVNPAPDGTFRNLRFIRRKTPSAQN
jgi:peptide/nickel transport system substrate-binding protein